ncbi:hypothetical protein NIIDMKKI_22100 [Mycobacterium kansasii]|uniref:Uncharacterized protein n=1 Tax=Mycobacterium kansasii TaxID=1768 RepID=A0A7G1I991_MYCKA|nr:hypothetical protein NIIDMKKI_22100 [Mycobacterium kansasii]
MRGRVADAQNRAGRIRITVHTDRPQPADRGGLAPAGVTTAGLCHSAPGNELSTTVHDFDLVVDGSGADPLWFLPLLDQDAVDMLELELGGPLTSDRLEESIGHDLAVQGLHPKLFLPNLSGFNAGPGFPNLSCLGLLADRVLGAEIGVSDASRGRSGEYQSV